jgi:putative intracellular protease/amidase
MIAARTQVHKIKIACLYFAISLLPALLLSVLITLPSLAEEHQLSVAIFVDRGASAPAKANFKRLLGNSNFRWKCIEGADIEDGCLKNFDALIVPGGSALKESRSMGPEAREEVRRFVRDGGIYLGVCAGAYLSSKAKENDLGLLPLSTVDQKHWFRVKDGTPVKVELTQPGMDVFGLDKRDIEIVYENGPIFGPPLEKTDDSFAPLGYYRSEVVAPGGERGVMLGAPAAVLSRYGRGCVLAISPHPEKTHGKGWIILHALQWMYEHREKT